MRLTLGTIKTDIANALGLSATGSRVTSLINRAQERLIYMGKWVGTMVRYRVCVNNACLTWPRQVETIEAWALCDYPGSIRNSWYEFLSSGPGIMDEDSCNGHNLIDRGISVAFDDVTGDDKKLAIYADVTETTTEKVIVRFTDENGNWVRTQSGTSWIDGEELTIPAAGAYTYTTNKCAPFGLTSVIKPATNGVIRLYEYDTVNLTYKPLAYYESDETIPTYRRSLIPGLSCTSDGTCDYCTVDIYAKLRHIPVSNDNDFLIIEHQDALRLACQALKMEEAHLATKAEVYWIKAREALEDQMRHWQGSGVTIPLRLENTATATLAITEVM